MRPTVMRRAMGNEPRSFGDLLRSYRVAAGLTQEELAERAKVSARAVSDLERGVYRAPRRDTIALLSQALGLSEVAHLALEATITRHRRPSSAPGPQEHPRHNLPAQSTPLIGRAREAATISQLLTRPDVRVVTLTGPGGIGKTRLALRVAEEVLPRFANGVFFIPLGSIADPAVVASAMAVALDVQEAGEQAMVHTLREYLRDKEMLLVLDNFEHVLPAASFVADLLTWCPRLKVLVTSRAVLRLASEYEFPIPPLSTPDLGSLPAIEALHQYDAVAFFVERATAVQPDFSLTDENAPAVAEVCARLDGLPLAIELATARIRLFSPEALLALLRSQPGSTLRVLTRGPRDAPERQQTLRGTMDWSYSLLTEGEQKLLARLSVFAGGCRLEAAEAVCNAERDLDTTVLEGITSLAEQSLLGRAEGKGPEPRVVMLETIREYGAERLEAMGEAEAIRRRHAEYYLTLAERAEPKLQGPEQAGWLERLEEEHDNLRVGLAWWVEHQEGDRAQRLAAALADFWYVRGHFSEGRRWLEAVLAMGGKDRLAHINTLHAAGMLAGAQGDYRRARTLFEESVKRGRAVQNTRGMGRSLGTLGLLAWQGGAYEEAANSFEEAAALSREVGDTKNIALTLMNFGDMERVRGNYARAESLLSEALELSRKIDNQRYIAIVLGLLGLVGREQGDYERAARFLGEGLNLLRELGDKRQITFRLMYLAGLASAQGRAERAARLFGAAEALRESIGMPLEPNDREWYDRDCSTARVLLGDKAWTAAWNEGRAMTPEQAIEYAIGCVPGADGDHT